MCPLNWFQWVPYFNISFAVYSLHSMRLLCILCTHCVSLCIWSVLYCLHSCATRFQWVPFFHISFVVYSLHSMRLLNWFWPARFFLCCVFFAHLLLHRNFFCHFFSRNAGDVYLIDICHRPGCRVRFLFHLIVIKQLIKNHDLPLSREIYWPLIYHSNIKQCCNRHNEFLSIYEHDAASKENNGWNNFSGFVTLCVPYQTQVQGAIFRGYSISQSKQTS